MAVGYANWVAGASPAAAGDAGAVEIVGAEDVGAVGVVGATGTGNTATTLGGTSNVAIAVVVAGVGAIPAATGPGTVTEGTVGSCKRAATVAATVVTPGSAAETPESPGAIVFASGTSPVAAGICIAANAALETGCVAAAGEVAMD